MQHDSSSKNVWKFRKLFSSDSTTTFDKKVILVEKGETVFENEEIATHYSF